MNDPWWMYALTAITWAFAGFQFGRILELRKYSKWVKINDRKFANFRAVVQHQVNTAIAEIKDSLL